MAKTYEIEASTEAALVAFIVTDASAYNRIGHALDADMLPNTHAKLVVEAVQAHHRESKGAACSPRIVAQRLRALRTSGRLTLEDTEEAKDWLLEGLAQLKTYNDKEAIIGIVADVVRYHMHRAAWDLMSAQISKRATDMSNVLAMLSAARSLGLGEETHLLEIDEDILERVAFEKLERVPTGIEELDDAIGGGWARGELLVAIGNAGDGKSMLLSQIASEASLKGHLPFVVTLELSRDRWIARLLAASAGIETKSIMDRDYTPEQAERIRQVAGAVLRGVGVRFFSPGTTHIAEIWAAFDKANSEREVKGLRPYTVLVLDYADKLAFPKEMKSKYEGDNHTYEMLRLGGLERNVWTATASQSTRQAPAEEKKGKDGKTKNRKLLGLNDGADSQGKVRVADIVITLNATVDRKHTQAVVVKNRNGEGHFTSALIPTDYGFGRLTKKIADRGLPEVEELADEDQYVFSGACAP